MSQSIVYRMLCTKPVELSERVNNNYSKGFFSHHNTLMSVYVHTDIVFLLLPSMAWEGDQFLTITFYHQSKIVYTWDILLDGFYILADGLFMMMRR